MKTIFRFTLLALIVTAFCACDDDKSYVAPLDVTPNNLAGTVIVVAVDDGAQFLVGFDGEASRELAGAEAV